MVTFGHISHLFLVFLLLTLNKCILAGFEAPLGYFLLLEQFMKNNYSVLLKHSFKLESAIQKQNFRGLPPIHYNLHEILAIQLKLSWLIFYRIYLQVINISIAHNKSNILRNHNIKK